MLRRRRPLLRAAAVGGTAYAVGKRHQRTQEREATQDDQIAQLQDEPVPAPRAATGGDTAGTSDRIESLKQLKELLDSGVLTQDEFDREKQKVLSG